MEAIAPAVERGREMNDLIYRQDAIDAIDVKNVNKGIISALQSIIEELPSAEQWIPMSERPPEKPGRYLVTNCEFVVDWNIWVNGEWLYSNSAPVAWMPLPEPYKGDEL